MNSKDLELDEQLERKLNHLRGVPPLNQQEVAEERQKFLALGESLRQTVSQPFHNRHKVWINQLLFIFQRKEYKRMFNTVMAIILTLTFLFGGTGATVYAAQNSQPDGMLYAVKTWSEDLRIAWANSLENKLSLTLEFSNRRMTEIEKMRAEGKEIPESVALRFHQHLETALQLAVGMEDPQMVQAMARIRQQAEVQARRMLNIMTNGLQGDPIMTRLQERLQEQVRLAAQGENDPQEFRLQIQTRERERFNMPTQRPENTPLPTQNSYGPGNGQPTDTPGQYGPGQPNPSKTPEPDGGSYGPGPGASQPTSTPGGYGPGPSAGTATCTQAECTRTPNQNPGNPSATPKPDNPGIKQGEPTVTPNKGNGSETAQPTSTSGKKGGQP